MASKNSFRLPMRGRYVNPRVFENYELDDAERETKLPVFKTLVGLWCHADKAGRFVWDLRKLQIHLFPFQPQIDLAAILSILRAQDVVKWYEVDGKQYGWLVKFREYQYLSKKEPPSALPPHPQDALGAHPSGTEDAPVAEAETEMTDDRCTKTETEGLKTDNGGTPKISVKHSVKHSVSPQTLNISQSQSSDQFSSVQDGPYPEDDETLQEKTPLTIDDGPLKAFQVRNLWRELGLEQVSGPVSTQLIAVLCKKYTPVVVKNVMVWAWKTSKYWFKDGEGRISDCMGFSNAFPTILKQYTNYVNSIPKTSRGKEDPFAVESVDDKDGLEQ